MLDITVLAATLAVWTACMSTSVFLPIAPFIMSRREVGWAMATQGCGNLLALLPTGRAVDKFGAKRVLPLGLTLLGCGAVISSLSRAHEVQLIGRIFAGIAAGITFNASMAMIMERFKEPLRAEHLGTALGVGTLGNLAGPPVSGYLFDLARAADWREPQMLPFFALLLSLAVTCVAFRPVPEVDVELHEHLLDEGSSQSFCQRYFGIYIIVGLRSWAIAVALANLFGAGMALLCAGVLSMSMLGFSPAVIGLVPVPAGVAQALCARWGGQACHKPGRRALLMVWAPLGLAGCLAAVFAASEAHGHFSAWSVVAAIALSSAAIGVADAPSMSLMAGLAKAHRRGYGEAVTASELAVTLGQATGPLVGALIQEDAGFFALCGMMAVSSGCAGAFCAYCLLPEDEGQRH